MHERAVRPSHCEPLVCAERGVVVNRCGRTGSTTLTLNLSATVIPLFDQQQEHFVSVNFGDKHLLNCLAHVQERKILSWYTGV